MTCNYTRLNQQHADVTVRKSDAAMRCHYVDSSSLLLSLDFSVFLKDNWSSVQKALLLSSDVPPETPSTSRAASGQLEASQTSRAQDGGQGEASAEANTSTASTGTAPLSATQPHWGFNATSLTLFVLLSCTCDFAALSKCMSAPCLRNSLQSVFSCVHEVETSFVWPSCLYFIIISVLFHFFLWN